MLIVILDFLGFYPTYTPKYVLKTREGESDNLSRGAGFPIRRENGGDGKFFGKSPPYFSEKLKKKLFQS